MTKFNYKLISVLLMLLCLSACTTAMYTSPSPVNANQDRYEFTIETGGFSGAAVADQRAVQEFKKFMAERGYTSYKLIHRTDEFIPSGFKYTVQFYR